MSTTYKYDILISAQEKKKHTGHHCHCLPKSLWASLKEYVHNNTLQGPNSIIIQVHSPSFRLI